MRSGDCESAQRADRDREEREVGRDQRDRHPVLPLRRRRSRSRDPQLLTIGAKAMSGTVWLRMIQGSSPHSARRQRCMIEREGDARRRRPTSQPTAAIPRVVSAREATTPHSGGEPSWRVTGSNRRRDHVPDVRHREVGGARGQHARARRSTTPSVGGEELVQLPHGDDREMPDRPQPHAEQPRRRPAGRRASGRSARASRSRRRRRWGAHAFAVSARRAPG